MALLSSGVLFSNHLFSCKTNGFSKKVNSNYGLQLYTLRDDMANKPLDVLKRVASFGYKEIESFEGSKGMFWGKTNKEFKQVMDDLGMSIVASHCDMNTDFDRKAAEAAAIGMKYLICPHLGAQKNMDAFKKFAEKFNQCGEICKKNGLRFAYHNHAYSFELLDGQYPQDVLMQQSDKDLVDFEMDMYWVVTAGADPEAWIKKYPGRFKLSHVKDRMKNAAPANHDASVVLGTGSINYAQILETAGEHGMNHFMVEQEAYVGTTPLNAVKENAVYMHNLKLV